MTERLLEAAQVGGIPLATVLSCREQISNPRLNISGHCPAKVLWVYVTNI